MPVRNFLSVTFDDLNAFAFIKSLYPGVLHTPNIDRVMATGTTFENAYSQVAICNASRTSVLSGLNPGLTGVHQNFDLWSDRVDPALTLPGILTSAGFDTSLIGKVFHAASANPEIAAAIADFEYWGGPNGLFEIPSEDHALPFGPSANPLEPPVDAISADLALERLAAAGEDPFALFLGLVRPHLNWVVPQEYLDLYPLDEIVLPFALDGDLSDVPEFMRALVYDETHQRVLSEGEWKAALQHYFASISYADAQLGRVLDALEANGQLDDTMILLWTDHGYHLGDKDNWHKFTLWEEAARAPFVLALPGVEDDGQRVGQVVELVDIMPTVLDLLGVAAPGGLSGRSLRAFIDDPALTDGGVAITTMYGSAAIRSGDWRYIRYADGSTELYDLASDPNQWTNLAGAEALAATQGELDARMRSELEADGWVWVEAGESLDGGPTANTFVLAAGAVAATGGAGDDSYFLADIATQIVELSGEGTDTVFVSADYTLPDDIENLQIWLRAEENYALTLVGNDLDNAIVAVGEAHGLGGDDYIRVSGARGQGFGGDGDDIIFAGNGRDVLKGGDGADLLAGGGKDDVIEGGAGADTLYGRGAAGIETGIDTLSYAGSAFGVAVSIVAGMARRGDADGDTFLGFENLDGSAWADQLTGDDAANTITANAGDDKLSGLGGADRVYGGDGDDVLNGGDGDDIVDGGAGADAMRAGLGDDLYLVDSTADTVLERAGEGSDRITASVSYGLAAGAEIEYLVASGAAADAIDLTGNARANGITGHAGANVLAGLDGVDLLRGVAGDDALHGGEDNDRLDGGEGADLLRGGSGRDILIGGAGRDEFEFHDGETGAIRSLADAITDFDQAAGERLRLDPIDADTTAADDQAFAWLGTAAFTGTAGELRFVHAGANTYIEGDTDGDGVADLVIRLNGLVALEAADFVL